MELGQSPVSCDALSWPGQVTSHMLCQSDVVLSREPLATAMPAGEFCKHTHPPAYTPHIFRVESNILSMW